MDESNISMIKVMNSVEIEKKIRELVGHYLIKDYHVTVKRGDVILWLPDICKDSPFNKLVDEVISVPLKSGPVKY